MEVTIGDEVKVAPGLTGRVEEIITDGAVLDPLTIEEITGTKDDPAVLIVTADQVKTVVNASELQDRVAAATPAPAVPEVGQVVSWDGGKSFGVVDLVVETGQVPGIDGTVLGTKDDPAVRVRTSSSTSTGPGLSRVAVKVAELSLIEEPEDQLATGEPQQKTATANAAAPGAVLVDLLASHEAAMEAKGHPSPSARAVKAVWERGLASYPGPEVTSIARDDWGVGRVKAFLAVAAGNKVDGYFRDGDLLPQ